MAQLTINVGQYLLRQCSKPKGWLGRLDLWSMNRRHAKVTAWGLAHVSIGESDTVLDVGCGGGTTIARLAAAASNGKVYGVDYSETSVQASRATNQKSIDAGRVDIRHGSVSQLPFGEAMFDLVTAVETHYYWPDLVADLREILRVIKPGGTLAIIAEAYKGGKYDRLLQKLETLQRRGVMNYAHLTVADHEQLLARAGYADVRVFENYDKGWLCAIGRKPA